MVPVLVLVPTLRPLMLVGSTVPLLVPIDELETVLKPDTLPALLPMVLPLIEPPVPVMVPVLRAVILPGPAAVIEPLLVVTESSLMEPTTTVPAFATMVLPLNVPIT